MKSKCTNFVLVYIMSRFVYIIQSIIINVNLGVIIQLICDYQHCTFATESCEIVLFICVVCYFDDPASCKILFSSRMELS